jgi:hypothetical protein
MILRVVTKQADGCSETTFAAHFTHIKLGARESSMTLGRKPVFINRWSHKTVCTIHAGPCAAKVRPCDTVGSVSGQARCSRLDNFDKAKGRKLAFSRAISSFPRPLRAELWHDYLIQTGVLPQEPIDRAFRPTTNAKEAGKADRASQAQAPPKS